MKNIIEKLNQLKDTDNKRDRTGFESWDLEEQKQLLDIYLIISKKEYHIFDLIYSHHGCDSWEDIFRDYKIKNLKDKAIGVEIAIEAIQQILNEKNNK